MATGFKEANLSLMLGKKPILIEMHENGISCLERLWAPSHWRSSKRAWMKSCQVCYHVDSCMGWTKGSAMFFPTLASMKF